MASNVEEEETLELGSLFQEPEGYFPPPKPATFSQYRMRSGQTLQIRLVGHHSLWGYLLWNAGRTVADILEQRAKELIEGKDILELGAGAGLPSLVSAIAGARTVVVTDYPDVNLLENLRLNASACDALAHKPLPLYIEGYMWGASASALLSHLPSPSDGFDVLILADVIYSHPHHHNLISSIHKTMRKSPDSVALVVFTPYQPWLLEKIVAFFPLAEASGFAVKKIFEKVMDKVLFEEDPGDEKLRRTVYGYELRWKEELQTSS